MWRLGMETIVFGSVCLLFAGKDSLAEVVAALLAGLFATWWHARLLRYSAFRFKGRPNLTHILKLAVQGALCDVPKGGWRVLSSLRLGRFGKRVTEPAPVLIHGGDVLTLPKRRALAMLATSFGPLAYTVEAYRQEALRVHRARGTKRSE